MCTFISTWCKPKNDLNEILSHKEENVVSIVVLNKFVCSPPNLHIFKNLENAHSNLTSLLWFIKIKFSNHARLKICTNSGCLWRLPVLILSPALMTRWPALDTGPGAPAHAPGLVTFRARAWSHTHQTDVTKLPPRCETFSGKLLIS